MNVADQWSSVLALFCLCFRSGEVERTSPPHGIRTFSFSLCDRSLLGRDWSWDFVLWNGVNYGSIELLCECISGTGCHTRDGMSSADSRRWRHLALLFTLPTSFWFHRLLVWHLNHSHHSILHQTLSLQTAIIASPSPMSCSIDATFGPHAAGCRGGFDFTLLFEECILSIIPIALILIVAPFRIHYLFKRRTKVSWSLLLPSKLVRGVPPSWSSHTPL